VRRMRPSLLFLSGAYFGVSMMGMFISCVLGSVSGFIASLPPLLLSLALLFRSKESQEEGGDM